MIMLPEAAHGRSAQHTGAGAHPDRATSPHRPSRSPEQHHPLLWTDFSGVLKFLKAVEEFVDYDLQGPAPTTQRNPATAAEEKETT